MHASGIAVGVDDVEGPRSAIVSKRDDGHVMRLFVESHQQHVTLGQRSIVIGEWFPKGFDGMLH